MGYNHADGGRAYTHPRKEEYPTPTRDRNNTQEGRTFVSPFIQTSPVGGERRTGRRGKERTRKNGREADSERKAKTRKGKTERHKAKKGRKARKEESTLKRREGDDERDSDRRSDETQTDNRTGANARRLPAPARGREKQTPKASREASPENEERTPKA